MYSDILLRLEKIEDQLDFNIDLHVAIYIHYILKNIFDFNLDQYNNLIIIKNSDTENNRYDIHRFKYWIQFTFHSELCSELPIYNNTINVELNELRRQINQISMMKVKVIKTDKDELLKLIGSEKKLKRRLGIKEYSIKRENNVISKCMGFIVLYLNTDGRLIELFKNLKTVLHNL